MEVTYKGNNQLSESDAVGFFTFKPMSASPGAQIYMIFTPPEGRGYNLDCTNVQGLAFGTPDRCEATGTDGPLELKFENATILAENSYTIGIGVSNPGGAPPDGYYWGLLLQDHLRNTFDGNLRIENLILKSVPIRAFAMGWISAEPRVISTVSIQMRVYSEIAPGLVKVVEVQAPSGVMFNEDVDSVKIAPVSLPLTTAQPVQIMGDTLRWNLDKSASIEINMYNLRFEVSNPSVYPSDNTWRLRVMKDIEVEFSHVFTGYTQGQQSPFEVPVVMASDGGDARRQHSFPALAAIAAAAAAWTAAARARAP
jgi:hypothetical protein